MSQRKQQASQENIHDFLLKKSTESGSSLHEKRLKDLEAAFTRATKIIIEDDLMQVFKEKKETQIFMFERIQEIINEGMREANNKFVNQVMIKMSKLSDFNQDLKNENFELKKVNSDLQRKIDEVEINMNQSYQEKVTEFSTEVETFQANFDQVYKEKKRLEKHLRNQSNEMEGIVQSLMVKERSENKAMETIKRLEEINMEIRNRLEKKKSEVGYMEAKMDIFEKEKEDILGQLRSTQKELQRVKVEFEDNIVQKERKIESLDEEINGLKANNEEIKSLVKDGSKVNDFKSRIKELEQGQKKYRSDAEELKAKLDDSEFVVKQLKQTVQTLKGDLNDMTTKLSLERKEKHKIEIINIETKDMNSELNLTNSNLAEELQTVKQEFCFLKKSHVTNESELKKERRKAATLEREIEQLKFSAETLNRDNNELIVGFKNQVDHLKRENKNLGMRLEKNISSHQRKMEDERNANMMLKETLRQLKEAEENLTIKLDNLEKQVLFYKNKNLASTSKKNPKNQTENKHRVSLVDSSRLKNSMRSLLKQYQSFRNQIFREFRQLMQDFNYYQTSIAGLTDTLVIRLTAEGKKNFCLEKDIVRLSRNLEYLQKINDDFSVRLGSHSQSISRLSYNYESNSTFIEPQSKLRMEPIKDQPVYNNPPINGRISFTSNCCKGESFGRKHSERKSTIDRLSNESDLVKIKDRQENDLKMMRLKQKSENYTKERRMRDYNKYYNEKERTEVPNTNKKRAEELMEKENISRNDQRSNLSRTQKIERMPGIHDVETKRDFNSHSKPSRLDLEERRRYELNRNMSRQFSEVKCKAPSHLSISDDNGFSKTANTSLVSDNLHLIKFHTQSVTDETTVGKVTERITDMRCSIVKE